MNKTYDIDVSVIIVNWNALELTGKALVSLREQTQGVGYEVFVIDNGSTKDRNVDELPRQFPWIKFSANSTNLGFSKANNQAIRQSSGRYVLLLNADTVQIENALGKSIAYMDANKDVGVLGIRHLNHDAERSFQRSFDAFPVPFTQALSLFGFYGETPQPSLDEAVEQDVDWVCGSFMLMRRECLDQVGELDERFFVYDEDIDWCLRAKQRGWKVRFWSGAAMVHLGAASKQFIKDKTFMHFRSRFTYIRKNHSVFDAAMYYLAMCLRLTASTVHQTLRYLTGKATVDELRERFNRQRQFLLLRSSRTGC